ncbi:hypothetical protein AAK938_01310 [Aerococcaceae bacterium 50-4]
MYFKDAFARFYNSKMTISVNEKVKEGNVTKTKWIVKEEDIPCRISKRNLAVTGSESADIDYQVSLYCDPDVDVPAGSRIEVSGVQGDKISYKHSSEAFKYNNHQEIVLKRDDTA